MDIQTRILEHAGTLFMKYGVRSITMDDIARDLGISKKTIYQYFKNKANIIVEVSHAYILLEKERLEEIAKLAKNALDELVKVCTMSVQTFEDMSPRLMYEVQKYYPKAWHIFEEYASGYVLGKLRENLERGIKEGIYRAELDPDITSRIRVSQFDMSVRQDYFPLDTYDPSRVQIEMFELYLYGIVTDEGRALLEQYLISEGLHSPKSTTSTQQINTTKESIFNEKS